MAKQMMDYARDNGTYDLRGFVRVESTPAHQASILLDAQGEYPLSPLVGVGIAGYVDAQGAALPGVITQQFMMDGMEVDNLQVNPAGYSENTETIFPNAYYPG